MQFKFQVNLRGIIDLLSNHLYSGPQVFVRELLQNAVDAIGARTALEPKHRGDIRVEIVAARNASPPTVAFIDNGVGLTEPEVHRFLATIGESSKRGDRWDRPVDFLGQFGIGLLSCFLVSDEIVVLTRSSREAGGTVEWRGRPNGEYTVRTLERDIDPGTQVYLTCRPGREELFAAPRVEELLRHFGGLLPYPIHLSAGKSKRRINAEGAPWRNLSGPAADQTRQLLEYGRSAFAQEFFDAIPLHATVGKIDGVAFVLPHAASIAAPRTHRVYLKNMLLSENAEHLLPDWAFFVKCVVNANALRPTASRESFYEDEALEQARAALGGCLRNYLVGLSQRDPQRLQRLIGLHYRSIKALAAQDDEFFGLMVDWLPFETSLGEMSLGEYRRQYDVLRYVPDLDQFRQLARVAAAQSLCVINGGYAYDADLLQRFAERFPDTSVEVVAPATLAQSFGELTLDERDQVFEFVKAADRVLQPFKCAVEVRRFKPAELPVLFSTGADADFLRSVEQSRDVANPLWASVLGNFMDPRGAGAAYAQLCFNLANPLVARLAALTDRALLRRCVEMLYVQALLLSHRPLSTKEMTLLNDGMTDLIDRVVAEEK